MGMYTYLHFNGDCDEAFQFYQSVFGGEFVRRMTYGDAPAEVGIPDADKAKIMHIELHQGDSIIIGADQIDAFGPPATKGDNFSILHPVESRERADEIFPKLAEGGQVLMPQGDQFWGAYFGLCADKYGHRWMISFVTG